MLPARPRARELFFQWFPCVKIMPRHTLLQHVRQKKSDDEHHRASGAVNRKRLRPGSARLALERARTRASRGNPIESLAAAYLDFTAASPALRRDVYAQPDRTLRSSGHRAGTALRVHAAARVIPEPRSKSEVTTELFWASLPGIAELTRTKRFPTIRQKQREKYSSNFSLPKVNRRVRESVRQLRCIAEACR